MRRILCGSDRKARVRSDTASQRLRENTKRPARSRPLHQKDRNYFLGAIASLAALATRNFTTVLAGILISWPV